VPPLLQAQLERKQAFQDDLATAEEGAAKASSNESGAGQDYREEDDGGDRDSGDAEEQLRVLNERRDELVRIRDALVLFQGSARAELHTGSLQEIADAHATRVVTIRREQERLAAERDAVIRQHERVTERFIAEQEAALRRLIDAQEADVRQRDAALTRLDQLLATHHTQAETATRAIVRIRTRVAADGLDRLDVNDVFKLLHLLGTPVPRSILEKQEVTGFVLKALTEDDMQSVFNIKTLGQRRRLTGTLRVSAHRHAATTSSTFFLFDRIFICALCTHPHLVTSRAHTHTHTRTRARAHTHTHTSAALQQTRV
jgi:hypothetical protein